MWPSGRARARARLCVCVCVCVCVWKSAPRTADVTVTKIGGHVRVRILMNR